MSRDVLAPEPTPSTGEAWEDHHRDPTDPPQLRGPSTMTTDQIKAPDVHRLAATNERDTTNDTPAFYLGATDDTVLTGKRPKLAILLNLMALMDDDSDPLKQALALSSFIDKVLQPKSAEYVRARLADEDDDLDLDSPEVILMFEYLVGLWYVGPTGSAAGSRRSPSATGKRSTGRRPSKGKTR